MQSARKIPCVILTSLCLVACAPETSFNGREARVSDDLQPASTLTSTPVVIEQPMPYYPAQAHALKQSGSITVTYSISKTGDVDNAQVIESTPAGVFDKEVLRAMRKWHFKPGYPLEKVESRLVFNVKGGEVVNEAPVIIKSDASNSE
ncbi:MAG: energy transducer TonB [Leclercia sp.]